MRKSSALLAAGALLVSTGIASAQTQTPRNYDSSGAPQTSGSEPRSGGGLTSGGTTGSGAASTGTSGTTGAPSSTNPTGGAQTPREVPEAGGASECDRAGPPLVVCNLRKKSPASAGLFLRWLAATCVPPALASRLCDT
jgi:hypothetical protein